MSLLSNAYKISRRVAIGDITEVMLAAQHGFGGLEKLVVVKRVLPHLLADPQFVQVFVAEARNSARLRHQHIAEIYDVFQDEHDLCVVMEYLSGEDLAFITRASGKGELTIPVPIACRLISQAADGLHAAHTAVDSDGQPAGILHRDLSPGNVVVTYSGLTKLVDFGVARADLQDIYARPNTVKMKMAYRSPERLQHKELGEESDVYSLGVLLYELLVGRRLFRGDTEGAVLKAVMELKVPPPSKFNSDVSSELDDLVLAAIARDPSQRVPTANELRSGLDDILAKTKTFVSEHELHVWMTSGLADRFVERQQMERAVVTEGREVSRMVAGTSELPPMFGNLSGSEITVTPSSTSVSTMVGRTTGQIPPYASPGHKPSRTLVLVLLASLVTLILVILFGLAYWLGTRVPDDELAQDARRAQRGTSGDKTAFSPSALLVHVSPEGAKLIVDGKKLSDEAGFEGVLVPVAPGKKTSLKLRKEGFADEVLQVEAPRAGTKHVYVNLTAKTEATSGGSAGDKANGSEVTGGAAAKGDSKAGRRHGRRTLRPVTLMRVSFEPPDANVSIDGILRTGRSPIVLQGLATGPHRIIISAPGYETKMRMVNLKKGEKDLAVEIKLSPEAIKPAPVQVTSQPAGATVKIDGTLRGKTPLDALSLPAGKTYNVEVNLAGYQTWQTQLKVEPNTTNRIEAKLARK